MLREDDNKQTGMGFVCIEELRSQRSPAAPHCKGLEDRNIYCVTGYRCPTHIKGRLSKRAYVYDASRGIYRCPGRQHLSYRTTNREVYREYRSDPELCRSCPWLSPCTSNSQPFKTVTRHVLEDERERIDAHRLGREGRAPYKRRKETMERSFADAKQLHGHRYARMRGLLRAQEQCLLSAACQNMKEMALLSPRRIKSWKQPLAGCF